MPRDAKLLTAVHWCVCCPLGRLPFLLKVATLAQNEQLNIDLCPGKLRRRKLSAPGFACASDEFRVLEAGPGPALTKCFDRLPPNRNMLLHVLPATMRSGNIEETTSVLQSLCGDSESGSLPAERLYSILRNILEIILDISHVKAVRGGCGLLFEVDRC